MSKGQNAVTLAKPSPVALIKQRGPEQQRLLRPAMSDTAYRERRERRTRERGRAQEPDVELAEAECEQIRGQQDGDIAVGESAQTLADEQRKSGGVDARGQQQPR